MDENVKNIAESSKKASSPPKLLFIDGLRGALAICVVWYHILSRTPFPQGTDPGLFKLLRLATFGPFAVPCFILLSGFSLSIRPSVKGNLDLGFYWRSRFYRVYPGYLFALAISVATLLYTEPTWFQNASMMAGDLLQHLFLIQNFDRKYSINYALWSIAPEFQLYVILPAFVLASLGGKRRLLAVLTFLLLTGLVPILNLVAPGQRFGFLPHLIGIFFAGVLLSVDVFSNRQDKFVPRILLASVVANLILFVLRAYRSGIGAVFAESDPASNSDLRAAAAVFFGLLIWRECRTDRPLLKIFSVRLLTFLGMISYSVPTLHVPVLSVVDKFLTSVNMPENIVRTSVAGAAVTAATVFLAWISYALIEKPVMDRR